MREILFRGKRVETGEWLYGSVLNKIYGAKPVIVICSVLDDSCKLEIDYYHAEPDTIGQYTGLEDKNGVKIFEGDILRMGFYKNNELLWSWESPVTFENGAFKISEDRGKFSLSEYIFHNGYRTEFEVIGNIYEASHDE